jgi:hypothetical protein
VDAPGGHPRLGDDACGRKEEAGEVRVTVELIGDELRPDEITQARVAV